MISIFAAEDYPGSSNFSRYLPCQIELVAEVRGSEKIVIERSEIGGKQQKLSTRDQRESLTQTRYNILVNTLELI